MSPAAIPSPTRESAVVIMPRGTGAWASAEALWITAREWARAAERRFGAAWVATPDGSWPPDDLPRRPGAGAHHRPVALPAVVRTLLKDIRLALGQSRFEVETGGPWGTEGVRMVWEHHDLFNRAGERLARAAGAPLVRYVHAPQVWEAAKWGVRRPLWGGELARLERRHLLAADLVACVSAEVRDQLLAMGLSDERVLISPMGVDPRRFSPDVAGDTVRERHDLCTEQVVIGWCGSFRPFHGLENLLDAFARLAEITDTRVGAPAGASARLLLVGDGELRPALTRVAAEKGILDRVVFTGAVPHHQMPGYVSAMDIAVVSSTGPGSFHYSPLKVREYAAAGRPLVAPDQGEMSDLRSAGFADLYRPGDAEDLARALRHLVDRPVLRRARGERARAHALAHWTWDSRLDDALAACRRLAGAGGDEARA